MSVLEKNIHLLVVEDNPGDYVLIQEYLYEKVQSAELTQVSTLREAQNKLQQNFFDAILLDLTLPDASGEEVVRRVVNLADEKPVIVLTGYENEEFGLKTLSMGVADYLLKDELNPFVLFKSISYSMERSRINRSLQQSEQQYRDLFDLSPLPKWVYDLETMEFLDVNRAAIEHYGYSREEFLSMTITDIRPEKAPSAPQEAKSKFSDVEDPHQMGLFTHRKKDGELIQVELQSSKIDFDGRPAKMVIADDVTEQKKNEAALLTLNKKLETAQEIAKLGYWQLNTETGEIYWSDQVYHIWERDPENYQPTLEKFMETIHPDDRPNFARHHQLSLDGQIDHNVTHRIILPDGSTKWVQERGTLRETGNNDRPVIFEGTVQDITEKMENERRLQESLERYEYVTKATQEVIYDWDIGQDRLKWDDSFYSKFSAGSKDDPYTIHDWNRNLHPEDRHKVQDDLTQTLEDPSRDKWEMEYQFRKNDGNYATVFERGFILRDQKGNAIRMIGSLQDITERKEHEEKLRQLSLVASKTTDVIIITDAKDRITWVNNAFEKLTGYSREEVLGENPGLLLQGPETDADTINRMAKAVENAESIQEVVLNYTRDGEPYWLDLTIDPIFDEEGNCEMFVAIEKDVTEQIEQQKKLWESVERYETVSKATSDTIWDLDLINDITLYNENIKKVFGYEDQQVNEPWQWWKEKIHPEDRPQVIQTLEEGLKNRRERVQFEYRFQAADGSYKNIYDRAYIVTNEEGTPIRMIGAMQDVTKRKEEEQWLRLFESAISTTRESVAIIEAEPEELPGRQIIYVNQAFSRMTGYTREEVIGETLQILNGPNTSEEERQRLSDKINNWESCEAEFINYTKEGEQFWIHVSYSPVKDKDGNYSHWVCVGRDVTSQKEREQELKVSLAEKETLLMEIHHRVKNNLAVVSGMMQLQAFGEEDERVRQKLFESVSRVKTMATIHELLYRSESFSKLRLDENVKKLVSTIVDTVQSEIDLNIQYNLDSIVLNINQAIPCSLIVNEVVTNALQHAFRQKETGRLWIDITEKNNQVNVKIKDDGHGLPEDFDNISMDNSLGLKLIETLATQLGGKYSYDALDNGTQFSFTFPKAEPKGIGNVHLK